MANADREISMLPALDAVTDETLVPVYQPGAQNPAQSMTGAQFRAFAEEAAAEAADRAEAAADRAEAAADRAEAAGVQPDWNQNDNGSAGYIKNRPFYSEPILTDRFFVDEREVEFVEGVDNIPIASVPVPLFFSLSVGQTYSVYWNGKKYNCVAEVKGVDIVYLTVLKQPGVFEIGHEGVETTSLYVKALDPHYDGTPISLGIATPESLVPEWIGTVKLGVGSVINATGTIQQNRYYFVRFDGNTYVCACHESSECKTGFDLAIGNYSWFFRGAENEGTKFDYVHNNEPFGILRHAGQLKLYSSDGEHTVEVMECAVVKLPNEYLDTDYIKEVAGEHGGGDSVQSDWNQNDEAAADYIKNRPFYDDSVVILPETTLVYEDDGFFHQAISGEFDIKPGETYIVKWNGVEYEGVGYDESGDIYLDGVAVAYITYYPNDPTPNLEIFAHEAGTVTVSISQGSVTKLPNKYLDMTAEEWTFELEDGTTVTKQVMVK